MPDYPPLGRFAPSHITFGDIRIWVISRGARSYRSLAKYYDECSWNGMLKTRCYRLAPFNSLLFGGNHNSSNLCQKCANMPWHTVVYITVPYHAQTLHTLSRFAPSHITFGDIEIYVHFQRRSLNIIMNIIWNGMLKALYYRLAPLPFGGNYIIVIFAQNE